jgi:hypothetical protein
MLPYDHTLIRWSLKIRFRVFGNMLRPMKTRRVSLRFIFSLLGALPETEASRGAYQLAIQRGNHYDGQDRCNAARGNR